MFFRWCCRPLRERPEDFAELVAHFARQVAAQNGWKEKLFAADAIAELRRYSWPGNVRELRNVVERLVLLSTEDSVTAADVRLVLPGEDSGASSAGFRNRRRWSDGNTRGTHGSFRKRSAARRN